MTNTELRQYLKFRGACYSAMDWLGDRDLATTWAECERADWLLWLIAPAVSRTDLADLARECTGSQAAIHPLDAISAVQNAGRDCASKAHNKQILARAEAGKRWDDREWEAAYAVAFGEAHKAMCAIIRAKYQTCPVLVVSQ